MLLRKTLLPAACIFAVFLLITAAPAKSVRRDQGPPPKSLVIWALSDIQPGQKGERVHFETAVNDVKENIPAITLSLLGGDMVHYPSNLEYWRWFLETRKKASIPYWFEIAGNHETRNLPVYRKYINKPLHYAAGVGNIIMLCMSDEDRQPSSGISDATFRWWKQMVIANQDKIIITMTHAPLRQSGLSYTLFPTMIIRDSGRFFEVLKKHRVDLWISGHAHQPYFFGGKNSLPPGTRGTLFINVSSIKQDFFLDPIESRVLYFTAGSTKLLVRTRDHGRKTFVKTIDIEHTLGHPFLWDGSSPRMLP